MNRRPLVLLVDDEDDLREVTALVLGEAGYDVSLASHGGEAIELLEGGLTPDAIILDLTMPVMNGWDVWDWLQRSSLTQTPVIIWTATGLTDGAVSTARVIAKSDPKLLLKVLREVTTAALGPAATPASPPSGTAEPQTATQAASTPAEPVNADDDGGGEPKA